MFDFGSGSLVSVRRIVEQFVEIVGSSIEPALDVLPDRPFARTCCRYKLFVEQAGVPTQDFPETRPRGFCNLVSPAAGRDFGWLAERH